MIAILVKKKCGRFRLRCTRFFRVPGFIPHRPHLVGAVFGAGKKLDGAIVVPFQVHRGTTIQAHTNGWLRRKEARGGTLALPIMARVIAKMAVRPVLSFQKSERIVQLLPIATQSWRCLLYTSPSPRDRQKS